MNIYGGFKQLSFAIFKSLSFDSLFRYLNREKILILAYHGITEKQYKVKPWVMIPRRDFELQIKYISQRYNVIPLKDAVKAIRDGTELPRNAAVITFDDGYKNNLTVALPILQKHGLPATIFLTTGFVGTNKILPLDEAYLTIVHAGNKSPFISSEIGLGPLFFDSDEALYESYLKTVMVLKKFPTSIQWKYIDMLRKALDSHNKGSEAVDDFLLLSWEDVEQLLDSGIIQIGAHTISHDILTNLSLENAYKEISQSKSIIVDHLSQEVSSFAYPNGTEADYNESHIRYLKKNDFMCSVTTVGVLNKIKSDPYRLGRICVGPELTASPNHFALKVSGFTLALKRMGGQDNI